MYVAFVTDTLISIGVIAVAVWLVYEKRASALSRNFKISLCLLILMMLFFETRSVFQVANGLTFHKMYKDETYIALQIVDTVGKTMQLTFAWFFSSHFLQVACLLRLSFSKHTLQNLEKIRRRKRILFIVDVLVYTGIACIFFSTIFIGDDLQL